MLMSKPSNDRWVCVDNLNPKSTYDQLISLFRRCGEMSLVKFIPYTPGDNSRSIWLMYDTVEEMNKALQLTEEERTLGGRILTVKKGEKLESVNCGPDSSASHSSGQDADLSLYQLELEDSPDRCERENPFFLEEGKLSEVKDDYESRLKAGKDAFKEELKRFKCLHTLESLGIPIERPLGTPPPSSKALSDEFQRKMSDPVLWEEYVNECKKGWKK